MKQGVLYTAKVFLFPPKSNANPILSFTHQSRLRSYSCHSSKWPQTQHANSSGDVEDVGNQELKRRIDKYLEGDEEAIPSIFEAILKRKLAGKHEESDDELMQEIRCKTLGHHVNKDECDSEQDIC